MGMRNMPAADLVLSLPESKPAVLGCLHHIVIVHVEMTLAVSAI